MLIRLKAAGLWQCELSNWHRTSNGNFTLDRLYGGPQAPWRWLDDSPLRNAWDTGAKIFGTGMVYLENKSGLDPYKPVVYDVRRTGTGVAVLWGRGIKAAKHIYPLFARAAGSSC